MWTLKKVHRVGELAAAIAVVVSLIFVGVEVAKNNQISIETSTQTLLGEIKASWRSITDNSEFACIYARGIQDYLSLRGSERIRLSAYFGSTMQSFQEMYILMQRGRVEPVVWHGIDAMLTESIQLPGIRQWFDTRRHWYSDEFQQYIDGLVGQFPLTEAITYDDPACSTADSS